MLAGRAGRVQKVNLAFYRRLARTGHEQPNHGWCKPPKLRRKLGVAGSSPAPPAIKKSILELLLVFTSARRERQAAGDEDVAMLLRRSEVEENSSREE